MSSQPRKDVPHKAGTLPAAGGGHAAHPREGEEHPDHGLLGDDVIHVPKGKNRLQYALLIGLLVFLTVIYLVPGALVSTFLGGNQDDPDYLAFEAPGGERTVLRAREYQRRRNGFADVLEIFEILKLFVGVQERNLSDDSAARLIVLDELTRDAGIVITDGELAQFLTEMRLDHPTWMMLTSRYGGPAYICLLYTSDAADEL